MTVRDKEPPHSCGDCGRVAHGKCRRRLFMVAPSARRQECRRSLLRSSGGREAWPNAPFRRRISLIFRCFFGFQNFSKLFLVVSSDSCQIRAGRRPMNGCRPLRDGNNSLMHLTELLAWPCWGAATGARKVERLDSVSEWFGQSSSAFPSPPRDALAAICHETHP
jgi:hypothetical protein